MAVALPFLLVASAAVGVISAWQQGQAAKGAAEYNKRIAEQNAGLSRQEAAAAAEQETRQNYLRLGAIATAQAKSGGVAGEGSVLDVLGEAASQGELQRQKILYAGELNARGFENTATLEGFKKKQANTQMYFQAGNALLNSASMYAGMKSPGSTPGTSLSVGQTYANQG